MIALLVLLVGCPRGAPALDVHAPPRLPAPEAGSYGRYAMTPADPVVATVTDGLRWDAYLSGAAAGLALARAEEDVPPSRWAVREAAWRAGYPYPVVALTEVEAPLESPAPEAIATWAASVEGDLGLVRARSATREVWIGLQGRPRVDLGVFLRGLQPGEPLVLPAVPGARVRLADPEGRLTEHDLGAPVALELEEPGEWLVEVRDAEGIAALFPLYVGMELPDEDVFPPDPLPLESAEAALAEAVDLLAEAREGYGLPAWDRDPLLDAVARRLLAEPDADPADVLADLGLSGPVLSFRCAATDVVACLDATWWRLEDRRAHLAPGPDLLGIAAALEHGTLHLSAVVAEE